MELERFTETLHRVSACCENKHTDLIVLLGEFLQQNEIFGEKFT